jgi:hypothetical protein
MFLLKLLRWSNPPKRTFREFFREMEWQKNRESIYFKRCGEILGPIAAGATYLLPVIRHQPLLKRAAISAVPGWLVYRWGINCYNDLRWTRGKPHSEVTLMNEKRETCGFGPFF